MSQKTDNGAKHKAKIKAKQAHAEQRRLQLNSRIADAIMDLCKDVLPGYIDDSKGIDLIGRKILWLFGMIAWDLAVSGQKEIDDATVQKMKFSPKVKQMIQSEINSLIRRKYEKYPSFRTSVKDISLNVYAGVVKLKVTLGDSFPEMPIPDFDEQPISAEFTPEVLRARRKELGLTQVKLAAELGVSVKTVSAWENGKVLPNEAVREKILDLWKDRE